MTTRRAFLRLAGVAGAGAVSGVPCATAATASSRAVLVDTTLCVGCRGCEAACAEANGLSAPTAAGELGALDVRRATGPEAFTVVNRAGEPGPSGAARYVKTQCLHCVDPACASACPVRALEKQPGGPVVYHADRCMGCRYCMVSCPFGVPKYEYDRAIPYVRKCSFCASRQAQGAPPACVEVCPSGALLLGTRDELLQVAHQRIYSRPGHYLPHVYGEDEAGGTSWLYVSDVPFQSLGLPDVRKEPYPELTHGALAAVPVVMTLWPPLLMALYAAARTRTQGETPKLDEDNHA